MKKMIIMLAMTVALSLQAQNSRITLGLGGGVAANFGNNELTTLPGPMGNFDFGYSITGDAGSDVRLGLRTGVNAIFSQFAMKMNVSETFTNMDYYGLQMDYVVSSSDVRYKQSQLILGLPVMFAIQKDGFYCNIGGKLMMPVWNQYKQEIGDVYIAPYYPDLDVTVKNDLATGLIPEDQRVLTGKASLPKLAVALSFEIGYVWNVSGGHSIGLDAFVDYSPWGFLGEENNGGKSLIEVAPIINDQEQPYAPVTVNVMTECAGFKWNYFNAGLKFVYAFDVE